MLVVNEVLEKGRNLFTIAMRGGQPLRQDSAVSWWNHFVGCAASKVGCAEGDDEVDALPACEGGPVRLLGTLLLLLVGHRSHFVYQNYCVGGGGLVG